VIITPFVTRLLAGAGAFSIRFSLYAAVQGITAVLLLGMSRLQSREELRRPGAPPPAHVDRQAIAVASALMFAVSIPVSFATHWAYACWVAIPLAARLLKRLPAWRPAPSPHSH
jgi:hypothetical protein